jgi:ribose transport system permease protein
VLRKLNQESLVFLVAILLFGGFSVFLTGFLSVGNMMTLLRSVAVLGILGVGMAIVVIGRGLDLSLIAVMTISSAWVLNLLRIGVPMGYALLLGLAFAVACGVLNGVLVAVVEIPPVFTTLALGIFVSGIGRAFLFSDSLLYLPPNSAAMDYLGHGSFLGIPMPTVVFVVIALLVHTFLTSTTLGRFIYAQGDNYETTRLTGIKVRPLIVLEYVMCSVIGYIGGVLLAASITSVNLSLINSTWLFDVLMVVVLGGISLVGGRGSIWSVVVGTALIGILINGMVVLNINTDVQAIVKGFVLLFAIVVDVKLHPRDEETARQGDI